MAKKNPFLGSILHKIDKNRISKINNELFIHFELKIYCVTCYINHRKTSCEKVSSLNTYLETISNLITYLTDNYIYL